MGPMPTGSSSMQGNQLRGASSSRKNREIIPKGYDVAQIQNFTPEMMQQFQQLFGYLGPDSDLAKLAGGDEAAFEQIEKPALRQFGGIQGNIASKFSGMGMGGRRSSGFQQEISGAASDFAQQLQSQRQGLKRQALSDLFNMSNILLSKKPYERDLVEKYKKNKPSTSETIGKWGGFIPGAVSSFFGGGSTGDAAKGASSIFGG